jgi:hypothetical protein
MGPFDVVQFKDLLDHTIPIRVHYHFHTPYIWKAAMYILAKGSPPIWHQLSIKVDSTVLQLIDDLVNERGLPGISRFDLLQIQRLSVERPVVAWKGFQ